MKLTPRQKEILRLVAEGHTDKAISGLLSISCRTVSTHVIIAMRTLGAKSRAHAVAIFVTQRLQNRAK
jgi:DNA-binding NarL/FixJ family response regulator